MTKAAIPTRRGHRQSSGRQITSRRGMQVIEGEQVEVDLPLFDVGLDASNDGQFRFSFSLFFFASLLFLAHGRSCPDEVSSISSL